MSRSPEPVEGVVEGTENKKCELFGRFVDYVKEISRIFLGLNYHMELGMLSLYIILWISFYSVIMLKL